jgi:aminopeptidase N
VTCRAIQLAVLAVAASLLVLPAISHAAPMRAVDVLHYAAYLEPDIAGKRLGGHELISLVVLAAGTRDIEFDAGELDIDRVHEHGQALEFEKSGQRLRVRLARPAAAGTRHEIAIDYQGAPRFGLEFQPGRGELYTIFSTSQWLVCIDAPDDRATLELDLVLPAGLKAVGNGRKLPQVALDRGRQLHRWRLDTPMPSYVYGFAAGRYVEVTERARGIDLHYLSTDRSPAELRRIFADTADMLRFFGSRAGLRYRGDYGQVLVARTIGQELAGFALMSEAHGLEVLEDSSSVALIAHEAAHQWWGNRVTCRDWNHFWLNEGFANFMAAAYLQRRYGEEPYRRQVDGWRQRLDKLRADSKDHSLVYENWNRPSADDRAVVYQKGAYVLHLLREALGEDAFWRGIRAYTRTNAGHSVTTADFKAAMEKSSGRDLSGFFDQWVFARAAPAHERE